MTKKQIKKLTRWDVNNIFFRSFDDHGRPLRKEFKIPGDIKSDPVRFWSVLIGNMDVTKESIGRILNSRR